MIWDTLHHTNNYSGWVTPKKIDPTTSWSQQPASQRKIYCIAIDIKYAIEFAKFAFAKNIGSFSNIDGEAKSR